MEQNLEHAIIEKYYSFPIFRGFTGSFRAVVIVIVAAPNEDNATCVIFSELALKETNISQVFILCTVLDMPESKEATEQIDWREKQPLQAACVSEDPKC